MQVLKKNYTCISFYLQAHNNLSVEIMNEWMMHLYSAFVYCCTPKALYNHVVGGWGGVSPQPPPVCSIHLVMRWLPQVNGASALTTHQLQVERRERVIEPIKWMEIISRPWLTRASGGNLARTPGLHPYSLREVPWDF